VQRSATPNVQDINGSRDTRVFVVGGVGGSLALTMLTVGHATDSYQVINDTDIATDTCQM